MKNGNEGAFTCYVQETGFMQNGLTKREYLAGLAMQGILANLYQNGNRPVYEWVSRHAIGYADELLKQLEQ